MADDESCEVDIEGDFVQECDSDGGCDSNELPSKSVNLLPEYTHHPWVLEQGWSLDNCADEKSKATIEKMLFEDQSLPRSCALWNKKQGAVQQKKSPGAANVEKQPAASKQKGHTHRKPWTADEKAMFFTALEIFGRKNWSKIAELIPSRNVIQVRNFGLQHFKSLSKAERHDRTEWAAAELSSSNSSSLHSTGATGRVAYNHTKLSGQVHGASNSDDGCASVVSAAATTPILLTAVCSSSVSPTKQDDDCHSLAALAVNPGVIDGTVVKIAKAADDGQDEEEEVDVEDDSSDGDGICSGQSATRSGLSSAGDNVYERLLQTTMSAVSERSGRAAAASRSRRRGQRQAIVSDSRQAGVMCDGSSKRTSDELPGDSALACGRQMDGSLSVASPSDDGNDASSTASSVLSVIADDVPSGTQDCPLTSANGGHCVSGNGVALSSAETAWTRAGYGVSDYEDNCVTILQPECGVLNSNGELVAMPAPMVAATIDRDVVTQLEKSIHFEFFDGRPQKTAERYMKIRNYILDQWDKCKPSYLYKTVARSGLKNCGDVNCIGRIHAFLEQIGAINFGCEQTNYFRLPMTSCMPCYKKRQPELKEVAGSSITKSDVKTRLRPVRSGFLFKDAIYDENGDDQTIEHGDDGELLDKQVASGVVRQSRATLKRDPLRLIRCHEFGVKEQAPYRIVFEVGALAVMDVHAHASKMEVIGILGGHFDADTRTLLVSRVEPCQSCSTAMHCEMDPVSQTCAGEAINDAGLCVIGWYHSHPSFVPHPSVTDVESQEKFQSWFARDGDHFAGVIISPYNIDNPSLQSEILCFTTASDYDTRLGCRRPYQLHYEITCASSDDASSVYDDVVTKIASIISQYAEHQHGVDLFDPYRSSSDLSCLSKMLASVRSHYPANQSQLADTLVSFLRACVSASYGSSQSENG